MDSLWHKLCTSHSLNRRMRFRFRCHCSWKTIPVVLVPPFASDIRILQNRNGVASVFSVLLPCFRYLPHCLPFFPVFPDFLSVFVRFVPKSKFSFSSVSSASCSEERQGDVENDCLGDSYCETLMKERVQRLLVQFRFNSCTSLESTSW